jgi:hypothetical protein
VCAVPVQEEGLEEHGHHPVRREEDDDDHARSPWWEMYV